MLPKTLCDKYNAYYTMCIKYFTPGLYLTENDSDRSIWWHYIVITVPDEIKHPDVSFVYVTGGKNTDGYVYTP